MKKEVYQSMFPWWNETKKKGSIINELKSKSYGKRRSHISNFDYNRSLRGISQKHTKNR